MELKKLEHYLTVCKVPDVTDIDMTSEFYFVGKTDEEISLVCKTEDTPTNAIEKDDGWKGFRIQGTLDFSLLSKTGDCRKVFERSFAWFRLMMNLI